MFAAVGPGKVCPAGKRRQGRNDDFLHRGNPFASRGCGGPRDTAPPWRPAFTRIAAIDDRTRHSRTFWSTPLRRQAFACRHESHVRLFLGRTIVDMIPAKPLASDRTFPKAISGLIVATRTFQWRAAACAGMYFSFERSNRRCQAGEIFLGQRGMRHENGSRTADGPGRRSARRIDRMRSALPRGCSSANTSATSCCRIPISTSDPRTTAGRRLAPVLQGTDRRRGHRPRRRDSRSTSIDGLGQLGVLGACLPQEFGGCGFSQTAYCQMMEVLGGHCGSTALFVNAHHSIGPRALVLFGTPEQQAAMACPSWPAGEWLSAFALTEPEAGSDAANVQTRPRPRPTARATCSTARSARSPTAASPRC